MSAALPSRDAPAPGAVQQLQDERTGHGDLTPQISMAQAVRVSLPSPRPFGVAGNQTTKASQCRPAATTAYVVTLSGCSGLFGHAAQMTIGWPWLVCVALAVAIASLLGSWFMANAPIWHG